MHYRRLGTTGLQLSALSFGAWITFGDQIGRSESRNLVAAAWDHGINFFDNAEIYAHGRAEEVMGDVIADLRLPRDGYAVSSKVYFGARPNPLPMQRGLSRKHVFDACHAAMKRLRVDYLDLYFCHRPDPEAPIAETVAAMDALVRQGKVLYWGTSEWPAELIVEAHRIAQSGGYMPPAMEQPEYNLLHRHRVEKEYVPLYADYGMGTTIWSPLASGMLTGKYANGVPADSRLAQSDHQSLRHELIEDRDGGTRIARSNAFVAIAREAGLLPAQLAIAWCLRNPHVSTVMLGASRVEQLLQNLAALDLKVDDATWTKVEAATAST